MKDKIEITRPTRANGKSMAVGDKPTVDKKTADYLVGIGKAKRIESKKQAD